MCTYVLCLSCPTLCDPMDYSLLGSSSHGISQARKLEQAAISYSRGSSQAKDQIHVSYISCTGRWILYHLHYWEVYVYVHTHTHTHTHIHIYIYTYIHSYNIHVHTMEY